MFMLVFIDIYMNWFELFISDKKYTFLIN